MTEQDRTAIKRRSPSAPARALQERGLIVPPALDYGSGYGMDAARLGMDAYDPFHGPFSIPQAKYNTILLTYVLNTLKPGQRQRALSQALSYLAPMGVSYVTVRTDKKNLQGPTRHGTYQKAVDLPYPLALRGSGYKTYEVRNKEMQKKAELCDRAQRLYREKMAMSMTRPRFRSSPPVSAPRNLGHAPQTLHAPQASQIPHAPQTLHAPQASQIPHAPQGPERSLNPMPYIKQKLHAATEGIANTLQIPQYHQRLMKNEDWNQRLLARKNVDQAKEQALLKHQMETQSRLEKERLQGREWLNRQEQPAQPQQPAKKGWGPWPWIAGGVGLTGLAAIPITHAIQLEREKMRQDNPYY